MRILSFILRGALGGLIGSPLFLIGHALHDHLRMGYVPYCGAFQIIAIPYVLVIGVTLGSIVGCLMWAIRSKAGIDLSSITRAIMGAGFILLLSTLRDLIAGQENSGLIPPTPVELLINEAMFFASFGALPAILACPLSGESLHPAKLSKWRKRELNYGLATSQVAICLGAFVLISPNFENTLESISDLLIVPLFFMVPGGLVGLGSYAHAAKRKAWGQAMLVIGYVAVVAFTLLLFLILPMYRISTGPCLILSFVLLATLSLVFSLLASKE